MSCCDHAKGQRVCLRCGRSHHWLTPVVMAANGSSTVWLKLISSLTSLFLSALLFNSSPGNSHVDGSFWMGTLYFLPVFGRVSSCVKERDRYCASDSHSHSNVIWESKHCSEVQYTPRAYPIECGFISSSCRWGALSHLRLVLTSVGNSQELQQQFSVFFVL